MKNLNYKKLLIWGISIIVFMSILITFILFFTCNSKTVETSSDNNANNIEQIIPNVTEENTTFKISDIENKVENVNISATNRLSNYNLYYCIRFDNNANTEINNEDYLVFNDLILVLEENCTILFKYELNGNYSNQTYEIKISNIESAEITEKVTEEELKKEKVQQKDVKKQSISPYFIKVNYGANVVTIYAKDDDGNYTVPYKAMVCSCGTYTPTSGTYKTTNKYVWRPLIDNVYGHYATRIVGSILFHSVPYTSSSNDTLEYWEYDKLGQTASAGCVRLTVRDAKWIYNNCPSGTMVEFYSNSNPGPLGKPSAQKISSNVECRNWDPTDPKEGNPWHTYNEKKNEEENTDNKENTTNNVDNIINTTITNSIANNTISENTITSDNSSNIITNNSTVENNNTATNLNTNNTINNIVTNNNVINSTVADNNSTTTTNNINSTSSQTNNSETNTSTNNQTNNNVENYTKPSTNNVVQNQL